MIIFFPFSISNFYWEIENWKSIFQFSSFEFNCRITQVEKPWLAFFKSHSLKQYLVFIHKRELKNFTPNSLKRDSSRNSNEEKGYT